MLSKKRKGLGNSERFLFVAVLVVLASACTSQEPETPPPITTAVPPLAYESPLPATAIPSPKTEGLRPPSTPNASLPIVSQPLEIRGLDEMILRPEDFQGATMIKQTGWHATPPKYIPTFIVPWYAAGNVTQVNETLVEGWLETYKARFFRDSGEGCVLQYECILEDYTVWISRYNKPGDYMSKFQKFINQTRAYFSTRFWVHEASAGFGDASLYVYFDTQVGYPASKRNNYLIYFSKNNIFVFFEAWGVPWVMSPKQVEDYARIVASRI